MAETIAVLSLKGGTGKTTTVRTLADVFRRIGLDVLCVDLDPQGNLSDYFGVPADASPTIADVLSGNAKAKEFYNDDLELLGIVMNIADMRTVHSREAYDALSEHFGDKVFETIIRSS